MFGCPLDNHIIILGCPVHDLVVSGEQTTYISNAALVSIEVFPWMAYLILNGIIPI